MRSTPSRFPIASIRSSISFTEGATASAIMSNTPLTDCSSRHRGHALDLRAHRRRPLGADGDHDVGMDLVLLEAFRHPHGIPCDDLQPFEPGDAALDGGARSAKRAGQLRDRRPGVLLELGHEQVVQLVQVRHFDLATP